MKKKLFKTLEVATLCLAGAAVWVILAQGKGEERKINVIGQADLVGDRKKDYIIRDKLGFGNLETFAIVDVNDAHKRDGQVFTTERKIRYPDIPGYLWFNSDQIVKVYESPLLEKNAFYVDFNDQRGLIEIDFQRFIDKPSIVDVAREKYK